MFRKNPSLRHLMTSGLMNLLVLLLLVFLLGLPGCRRTALERDFGNSWAYNQTVQIAHPEASLDRTPATGLSPQAAGNLMGAYNKSFAGSTSSAGSSTTINLGGLTTAGGGSGGK